MLYINMWSGDIQEADVISIGNESFLALEDGTIIDDEDESSQQWVPALNLTEATEDEHL